MLLAILALHENVAVGALYQRVVASLDRVDVELCSCSLGRYGSALAQAVSDLTLVLAGSLIEVCVILQSALLHFGALVHE